MQQNLLWFHLLALRVFYFSSWFTSFQSHSSPWFIMYRVSFSDSLIFFNFRVSHSSFCLTLPSTFHNAVFNTVNSVSFLFSSCCVTLLPQTPDWQCCSSTAVFLLQVFVFLTYRLPNPFISIFVILPSQSSTSFMLYVFPSACQTQLSARVSLCIYFLLQLTGGDFFLLSLLRNSYWCEFSLRFSHSLHRSISSSCTAIFFSNCDLLLVHISPFFFFWTSSPY